MTVLLLLSSVLLWPFFLAYTSLRAYWSTLGWEVKVAGVIFVGVPGLLFDFVVNWTWGLALGVTPDWTLSQKCGRLKKGGGWRATVAAYLCRRWLDPFEVDGHCRN